MDIDEKIMELKSSPLFAMSLSSKELFHSNFWAWLFERNAEYIQIFFPMVQEESPKVVREEKNRDISIHSNNRVYVVENKLKSMPYLNQLEDYREELGQAFGGGIITGIETPGFDCPDDWEFLSYYDIGMKIAEIAKSEPPSFEKDLIIRYAEMICLLCNVLKERAQNIGNQLLPPTEELNQIESIRMGDVVKKLNADYFVKYLNMQLLPFLKPVIGYKLSVGAGFSHKSAIIDIRYVNDPVGLIGIQIQGNQYRRCIQLSRKNVDDNKLYQKFADLKWFWDRYDSNGFADGRKTSMRKCRQYNKFITDEYHFLYQYWDIQDYSFDGLKSIIEKDMAIAATMLEDYGGIDCENM